MWLFDLFVLFNVYGLIYKHCNIFVLFYLLSEKQGKEKMLEWTCGRGVGAEKADFRKEEAMFRTTLEIKKKGDFTNGPVEKLYWLLPPLQILGKLMTSSK